MHTKTDTNTERHAYQNRYRKTLNTKKRYKKTLNTQTDTERHAYQNRYRKTLNTKNDTETDHFRLPASIQVFFGTSKFY